MMRHKCHVKWLRVHFKQNNLEKKKDILLTIFFTMIDLSQIIK